MHFLVVDWNRKMRHVKAIVSGKFAHISAFRSFFVCSCSVERLLLYSRRALTAGIYFWNKWKQATCWPFVNFQEISVLYLPRAHAAIKTCPHEPIDGSCSWSTNVWWTRFFTGCIIYRQLAGAQTHYGWSIVESHLHPRTEARNSIGEYWGWTVPACIPKPPRLIYELDV